MNGIIKERIRLALNELEHAVAQYSEHRAAYFYRKLGCITVEIGPQGYLVKACVKTTWPISSREMSYEFSIGFDGWNLNSCQGAIQAERERSTE
jgi:hypothetical protein